MSTSTISPNMSLIVPTAGQEPGPTYATDINTDMGIIDGHDHSSGSGVQITPAGININANLVFNSNLATNLAGLSLINQASTALQTIYVKPGTESPTPINDLWFNDGAGNAIQITSGGFVNATIASIPGESYAFGTFTWRQGTGSTTPANFDIGSITIRPTTPATTFGVTLSPPSAISSAYTINLPALPLTPSFLSIDNSGVMTAGIPVSGGITSTNISGTANILGSQLSPTANILGTQIGIETITGGVGGAGTGNIALNTISGAAGAASNIVSASIAPSDLSTLSWTGTAPGDGFTSSGTVTLLNISGFTPVAARPQLWSFIGSAGGAVAIGTILVPAGGKVTFNYTTGLTQRAQMSIDNTTGSDQLSFPVSVLNTITTGSVGSTHNAILTMTVTGGVQVTVGKFTLTIYQ